MKKGILFTLAYCLFIVLAIGIGLYYSTFDVPKNKAIQNLKDTEVTQSFEEALKEDNERVEKRNAAEGPDKWKPSPAFVLTAISIGAIADIVIVILWARHENKKREESNTIHVRKKRITDSNIFWWIIGLGIVQRKNNRLIIDWKYIVAYIVLGILLKVWITKELF